MKDYLHEVLCVAGLKRVAAEIERLALPSIRFAAQAVDETRLVSGTSKLGGSPDLPRGHVWPERNGLPLPFIAQVNLSDLTSFAAAHLLPPIGRLYFFFDVDQFLDIWPRERATWRVLYDNGPLSALQQVALPGHIRKRRRYHSCAITFSDEMTLPSYSQYDSDSVERLGLSAPLTSEEEFAYSTAQAQLAGTAEAKHHIPLHRLLGHADPVQADLLHELPSEPIGWQLLLQIDSDEDPETEWGDTGRIYYWIRKQDLQSGNFHNVELILQSS